MTGEESADRPADRIEAPAGLKWDLLDAAAVVCLDAGAVGVAAWLRDLTGQAAGPYVFAAARPAVVIPVVILLARRSWDARACEVGLAAPRQGSLWWFVKFAALVGLAYLALGSLLALASRGSLDFRSLEAQARHILDSRGGVLPTALVGLVAAPAAEEIVFRGVVYPAFREKAGRAAAVFASAAVFAGVHLVWQGRLFLPVTQFLGGIVFAWAYERTRSLLYPAIFHAVGNAGVLAWYAALVHRPDWVRAALG